MDHDDLWTRADEVLKAALDVDADRRPGVVDRMCGDDERLRAKVERLLVHAETGSSWPQPGELWPAPPSDRGALAPGSKLGPYEIAGRLGAGGMGVVYRARDLRIDRDVAIKLLPPELGGDDAHAKRFVREARIISNLNHPNILTIYEVEVGDEGPYIVSEIVDGPTLRSMTRHRKISADEAIDVFRQAATGLGKAHAADIVHRDIKPENLMVTRDGIVKILDFGIAKGFTAETLGTHITRTGSVAGTPGYIAPEQLRGDPPDARTDVFGLGVVIWELLAERHPYRGTTVAEIIDSTLNRNPPPLSELRPDVPAEFAAIVERCISRSREQRPADGKALVDELHGITERLERPPDPRRVRGVMGRVAGLLGEIFGERAVPAAETAGTAARAGSAPPRDLVVAVLPVADRSGDAALESVGAARILTDVFLHLLTDGARLQVVSPFLLQEAAGRDGRSVADAVHDHSYARALGEEAGANAVLTGALDKLPGGYVLGASITELATGRIRRSYRAEAPRWDQLLSELASSIGEEKQTPPSAGDSPSAPAGRTRTTADAAGAGALVERIPSQTLEAYANFVRGRDLADQGRYKDAIPPLEEAVTLDPELAVAWSEMGCAYYFTGDDVRGRAAHWKAAEHVNRASLKERLWIASTTAWVHTENGDLYRRRLQEFIDAFPDDRDGPRYMGHSYLALDDDPESAIPWLEKAYALTPGFFPTVQNLVEAHEKLGDRESAREVLRRYLALPGLTDFGRRSALELQGKLG